jgi:malonyl CoA-acyl carrier protein transacylase
VLAHQVSRRSRWEATLRAMADGGHTRFAEVGPGDVLAKLTRWTLRAVRVLPAEDPATVAALAAAVSPLERSA